MSKTWYVMEIISLVLAMVTLVLGTLVTGWCLVLTGLFIGVYIALTFAEEVLRRCARDKDVEVRYVQVNSDSYQNWLKEQGYEKILY